MGFPSDDLFWKGLSVSTKIASRFWCLRGIPATTKFILIKLADNSNDAGICWPSVPSIALECEVSERTVQAAIVWAEKAKLITREMRSGRSTVYNLTPADYSPPQNLHPAIDDKTPADYSPPPPQYVHPTPADYGFTHIEPSNEPSVEPSKEKRQSMFDLFWNNFPSQRKGSKDKAFHAYKKALTRTTEEIIHEAVIRYSTCDDVKRGFAKGAAAWLNDDRWTDEPCQQAATANRNTTYGDSLSNAANAVRNKLREEEGLRQKAS